jgi:trk system potassium uptake protein
MSNRILANLGFLMQIAGLLTILPIAVGLAFNETNSVVALFLACVAFLGGGFLLNALCERKDLEFKSANVLLIAAFILLPLIGALPYFYLDPFSSPTAIDTFTNGYFESVSGFTTTGFSFIAHPETLPASLQIYRSITELMGGVGIVFLLLAFFQSKSALGKLGDSLGIENVSGNLKKTFFSVLAMYGVIALVFTGIFYAVGFQNLISTGTFVIDTITGGFSPNAQNFAQYLTLTPKILIIIIMLIGGLNFAFIYNLFTLKIKKIFSKEALLFFGIVAVGTLLVAGASNISLLDSLFHVSSMSGSIGYNYIPMNDFGATGFSLLLVIMIIGGCAFSMAGGIRVSRLIMLGRTIKENVTGVLVKEEAIPRPKRTGNGDDSVENHSAATSVILFIILIVIFAIIFTTIGASFNDALFEVSSAFTTNGISLGYTTLSMGIGYKWLMIVAMTIGRVEILTILIAIFSIRKK